MNYTEKYHLPQWDEEDRVMRTDFNQMCVDMEDGLAANAQAAAKAQTAAGTAQSTAETALAHKNYVTGTYKGTRSNQAIELGFCPSAVIIGCLYSGSSAESAIGLCSLHVQKLHSASFEFTDTGFVVSADFFENYPCINWENRYYTYIAFR